VLFVSGSRISTRIWSCLISCLRSASRWSSDHCRCLVIWSRPSLWLSPRQWLQLERSNQNIRSSVRQSRRSSTLHFIWRVCTASSLHGAKCHRTQGNAIPLPPIFSPRRSLTSNFQKTQGTLLYASKKPHFSMLCIEFLHSFTVFTIQNPRQRRESECLITS